MSCRSACRSRASRSTAQRVVGDDATELIVTSHLAYGRVQGRDRLHVLKATHEKHEWKEEVAKTIAEDRIPWSACPREVKLQSFAKLPELLSHLVARVEEVANQTSRTIETVRSLIEAMKEPPQREEPAELIRGEEIVDDLEVTGEVPLRELTASAAPSLFRRPRPKSGAA